MLLRCRGTEYTTWGFNIKWSRDNYRGALCHQAVRYFMSDGCSLCLASRLILGILSSQIIFNYSPADHQSDTNRIDPRHETINRQIDSKTRIRGPSSPGRGYYKTIRGNISPAGAPGGARGSQGESRGREMGLSGPNWFDAGNTFQQNVIFPQT